MTSWTHDELDKIGPADEVQIAPRRRDGTLRSPITIWLVRQGDGLYIRSVNGRDGSWFQAAQARHEAHLQAPGLEKDVDLIEVGDEVNDQVDEAYRTKYQRYPSIVPRMVTPEVRATTLRLEPR